LTPTEDETKEKVGEIEEEGIEPSPSTPKSTNQPEIKTEKTKQVIETNPSN